MRHRYLMGSERFGPEANLHHITLKALTYADWCAGREVYFGVRQYNGGIGDLFGTGEEVRLVVLVVIYKYHACEGGHLIRHRERVQRMASIQCYQAVVVRHTKGERAFLCLVGEEVTGCIRVGRTNHHIDGERFVGYSALYFRLRVRIAGAVEMQGYAGGDTGFVGITGHLEVIILIEVVTGDGFVEAQLEVVSHAEDSISGFGLTEHTRVARIFDTGQYLGAAGDEARAVTAERYGAQVILLLHRVALAIETEVLDLTVLNHALRAGCQLIEAVLLIVRAEVDPCVVGVGRQFVLQLDMVEVVVVDIKAVNAYRHVVALLVFGREGIHDPFVGRRGDMYRRADRHEMHGEASLVIRRERSTLGLKNEAYILVVVVHSCPYLDGLGNYVRANEAELASVGQRLTVDEDLQAFRVGVLIQFERELDTRRTGCEAVIFLNLIPHLEGEVSFAVMRDIAQFVLVNHDLRVLDLKRRIVERCTCIIYQGAVTAFPRTNGSTAECAIYE